MDVCCECCVLSGRGLWDELITLAQESYRRCMWSRNLVNEEAVAHWGLSRQKQTHLQNTCLVNEDSLAKWERHTNKHLQNTYILRSLAYQTQVKATRAVSNQMTGCSEVCYPRCVFELYGEVNSVKNTTANIWLNDGVYWQWKNCMFWSIVAICRFWQLSCCKSYI